MKYLITSQSIVNALLAHSALRGDITGRGHILVDNDEAAINEILKTSVPALLSANRIPWRCHRLGWRVGPTSLTLPQVMNLLIRNIMAYITGQEPNDTARNLTDPDDVPVPLTPHYS